MVNIDKLVGSRKPKKSNNIIETSNMTTCHTEIISQLTDIHTHFGSFGEYYYPLKEVIQELKNVGVKRVAMMPAIPLKDDLHIPLNHDILPALEISDIEVIPILFTSPAMIEQDPLFKKVKDIPYKFIKIHPYGHNWGKYPHLIDIILEHAKNINIPIMIHTGYDESEPKNFQDWFKKYPKTEFILAHGKPADQAKEMLENYKNVWVDISFMNINGIQLIATKENNNRILFGTDIPITKAFYGIGTKEYYYQRVHELTENFGKENILKWGRNNFNKLIDSNKTV